MPTTIKQSITKKVIAIKEDNKNGISTYQGLNKTVFGCISFIYNTPIIIYILLNRPGIPKTKDGINSC